MDDQRDLDRDGIISEKEHQLSLEERRWVNRRKMAWWAFLFGSGFAFGMLFVVIWGDLDRVKLMGDLGPVVLGCMGFFAGIVMAYIGSAAYSDVRLWK